MIPNPDLWKAVLPVIDALEALGVPYHVGGSVASSFVGIARATQDADLIADLRPEHANLWAWADRLGVTDLLRRAMQESGLELD